MALKLFPILGIKEINDLSRHEMSGGRKQVASVAGK